MTDQPHPVHAIIESLGDPARLADRLSDEGKRFSPGTIGAWKHRRSIPVGYWPKLISIAADLGVTGVTNDSLAAAHQERVAA